MVTERQPLIERIANDFKYHPPGADDVAKHQKIRDDGLMYAKCMLSQCPESRELSLALTHLEEATMWANAAIARNT